MDSQIMATAGISTTGIAVLFIIYKVTQAIINKRLVSECCGRKTTMGVAVQTMSPADSNKNLHRLDENSNTGHQEHHDTSRRASIQDKDTVLSKATETSSNRSRQASIV